MGHNPGTSAVKKSERKQAQEKRTPEEILKGIRGNLAAHLSVTPSDIAFLLLQYDQAHDAALYNADKIIEQSRDISAMQAEIIKLTAGDRDESPRV